MGEVLRYVLYRWAVEASTQMKEANSNNGHEAESNAISNMSFHCNK